MIRIAALSTAFAISLAGAAFAQTTGPAAQVDNSTKPPMAGPSTSGPAVYDSERTGTVGMGSGRVVAPATGPDVNVNAPPLSTGVDATAVAPAGR